MESEFREQARKEMIEYSQLCDIKDCLNNSAYVPVLQIGETTDAVEWIPRYICAEHRRLFDTNTSYLIDLLMKDGWMNGAPRDDVSLQWVDIDEIREFL